MLAAAGYAEVDGTTTNIEGRVSTVARKITPPGTARADWMIAAELARLLGTDLGLESVEQICRGDRGARSESRRHHLESAPQRYRARWHRGACARRARRRGRPALLTYEAPADTAAPAFDAYSLRLVATRKLYDLGTATQQSPSLAGLVVGTNVRLNPYDFDRLGIDRRSATSSSPAPAGALTLEAQPDAGVPRGSAAVYLKQGPNVGRPHRVPPKRSPRCGWSGHEPLRPRPAPGWGHRPRGRADRAAQGRA